MTIMPSAHPLHGDIPCPNDYGSRPGSPSWGPNLDMKKAVEYERTLICTSPTRAEWDRRADARQAAWDASIFASGLGVLLSHGRTTAY